LGHKTSSYLFNFLNGGSCKQCAIESSRNSYSEVKTFIESQGKKLLSEEYVNNKSLLSVQCENGHYYTTRWNYVQQGKDCPECDLNAPEKEIKKYLDEFGVDIDIRNRKILDGLELDFVIPERRLAIEYCGIYWHSTKKLSEITKTPSSYHRKKLDKCLEKGYSLLTIFGDEWEHKKDLIKSKIRHLLLKDKDVLYTRVCKLKEVQKKEAHDFFKQNHLQGSTGFKYGFGLFYNNELVACITVGSPNRKHTALDGALEVKRLALKQGLHIPGAFGKIFSKIKAKAKANGVPEIISFCDLRWSTGNIYSKLGMELLKTGSPTPSYSDGRQRWRRQTFVKKKVPKNMYIIYDCGHQKWRCKL
jgi:hypothetical protein